MYLFQLRFTRTKRRYKINLHSTMYLFQHIRVIQAVVVVLDLHSTMYLFQQNLTI